MSNDAQNPKNLPIRIKITPPEPTDCHYSNGLAVYNTINEFILDFVQDLPAIPPKVSSRIIVTPRVAKIFCEALQKNIQMYESNFGEINLDSQKDDLLRNSNLFGNSPLL